MRTFIVGIDDGPKSLLASSVPYLQLHDAIVDIERFESEVDSDGDHVIFIEVIVCEAKEEGRLAHCRITYHDEFIEVIILLALHMNSMLTN
jgi:hypothetical protein